MPKPSPFSARSVTNSAWLTTSTFAVCIRRRALKKKHSPWRGHWRPMQLSSSLCTASQTLGIGRKSRSERLPSVVRFDHIRSVTSWSISSGRWNSRFCRLIATSSRRRLM